MSLKTDISNSSTTIKHIVCLFSLILIFCLNPVYAYADIAGKVIFSIGKSQVKSIDGATSNLRRGDSVNNGDTIITTKKSQVQIRMIDNALISVRPNSQFVLEEYVYKKNTAEDKSYIKLVKGGFRSVTGQIGKRNKSSYKLSTVMGTIGIRGTDYTVMLCNSDCGGRGPGTSAQKVDNGLYVGVVSGGVSLKNQAGESSLASQQYGHVASPNSAPKRIPAPPSFLMFDRTKSEKPASTQKKTSEKSNENKEKDKEKEKEKSDKKEEKEKKESSEEKSDSKKKDDEKKSDSKDSKSENSDSKDKKETDENSVTDEESKDETNTEEKDDSKKNEEENKEKNKTTDNVSDDSESSDVKKTEEQADSEPNADSEDKAGSESESTTEPENTQEESTTDTQNSQETSDQGATEPQGDTTQTDSTQVETTGTNSDSEIGTLVEGRLDTLDEQGIGDGLIAIAEPTNTNDAPAPEDDQPAEENTDTSDTSAPQEPTPEPIPEPIPEPRTFPTHETIITETVEVIDPTKLIVSSTGSHLPSGNYISQNDEVSINRMSADNELLSIKNRVENSSGGTASFNVNKNTSTTKNFGGDTDTGLNWGRWSDGELSHTINGIDELNPQSHALNAESVHWIVGQQNQKALVMPLTGSANYILKGNTDPTDNFGNIGVLGSANLTANFLTQNVTAEINLGINNQVWQAKDNNISLNTDGSFTTNNMSVIVVDSLSGQQSNGSGAAAGQFVQPIESGSNIPSGAAFGYQLEASPNQINTRVSGVAAFEKKP